MDTKTRKVLTILLTPFVIGFILGFLAGSCTRRHSDVPEAPVQQERETVEDEISTVPSTQNDADEAIEREYIIYDRKPLKYNSLFKEANEVHLNMAKQVGIDEPLKTRDEIPGCKQLIKLQSNRLYTIEELKFSSPYLTRNAADELDNIARAFRDSLKSKDLLNYKLIVSSMLRTQEDVRNLRKSGNPNASANSAHCYGTTFDIRYAKYEEAHNSTTQYLHPFELTKVLGEVLLDQQNAGNCIVKYEKKEHCFHITSTH